jgi:lipopolysaccharide/colanic/teichoic acid biosynthesis glycosyltransferase
MLRLDDRTNNILSRISKRAFDLLLGLVFFVISLPIQLVIATTILLFDRQFPIFAQKRVGLGGKFFWIYKFRTMKESGAIYERDLQNPDNRAGNEIQFKLKADPRVTTLGKVLRRFSLDELPQLLNVLSGSMSLVGPRPHVIAEVKGYDKRAANRLLIKPGITGAWQISGRSDLSWEESVQLDLNYVQNWSLVLDFVILLKTVWAVLRGQGAY